MKRLFTAVNDMRLNRKRFSISGSLLPLLLLLVLLLVVQTSARPSSVNSTIKYVRPAALDTSSTDDIDDGIADIAFDAVNDYADVDNVEWHHVKIVDGIMHEDHPIIMYKEDFVSEDYDPSEHKQKSAESDSDSNSKSHEQRRYKQLQRQRLNRTEQSSHIEQTEKYHALKPEKIYFDILPPTPVVVTDDSSSNDSKFDTPHIRVEVISLLDEDEDASNNAVINENEENESPSKKLLNKRPKKYHHHRQRRDTSGNDNGVHMVHKRHPHYNYERIGSNSFNDYANHLINYWGQKHAVPGNKWNGIDGDVPPAIDFGKRFGGEDNTDRVIWGSKRVTESRPPNNRIPTTTRRPQLPPLFHNSNPEDADFSPFTTRRPFPNNNNNRQPTRRPQQPQQPQLPPLFHNSNPEDADFSAFNSPPRRQQQQHHRKPQGLSFANSPTSPRNFKTINFSNERAGTELRANVFDLTDAEAPATIETESKLLTLDGATHCEKATNTCCKMTELNRLYDCFNQAKCTSSIAQIMLMCA